MNEIRESLSDLKVLFKRIGKDIEDLWAFIGNLDERLNHMEEWASVHDTIVPPRYSDFNDKPPCERHVDRRPQGLKGFSPSTGDQYVLDDYFQKP